MFVHTYVTLVDKEAVVESKKKMKSDQITQNKTHKTHLLYEIFRHIQTGLEYHI